MTARGVSADIFVGLVGLYLTYVGWAPAPNRPAAQPDASTQDLPRAT